LAQPAQLIPETARSERTLVAVPAVVLVVVSLTMSSYGFQSTGRSRPFPGRSVVAEGPTTV
jgi:hypothetical protein